MKRRAKPASPILGTAAAMIGEASDTLVTRETRFRHSFEAGIDLIEPHPGQARTRFDADEIAALAETMAQQGQLQPILLARHPERRGHWLIIAGERRWRAARHNGWPTILAIEHTGDPEIASLIENLQRVDLTPVEEARGLQRLIDGKGLTQAEAAGALGKSKGEISATLRILTLPPDLLEQVLTSELPLAKNVLTELARVEDGPVKERLLGQARDGTLTVRAIRTAQASPAGARPRADVAPGASAGIGRSVARLTAELTGLARSRRRPTPAERRLLADLRDVLDRLLDQE